MDIQEARAQLSALYNTGTQSNHVMEAIDIALNGIDLLQKQKDGLIIDLPNVSQADYCLVQSDLNDFIDEISYCDKSIGLQGITDNETKIYCAVMDGIKLAAGGRLDNE